MKKLLFILLLLLAGASLFSQGKLSVSPGFFTVSYFEGKKEISKGAFVDLLKSDPAAYSHYQTAQGYQIAASITGLAAAGCLIGGALTEGETSIYWNVAALSLAISDLFFYLGANSSRKKAVNTYNNNVELGTRIQLQPGRIVLHF